MLSIVVLHHIIFNLLFRYINKYKLNFNANNIYIYIYIILI